MFRTRCAPRLALRQPCRLSPTFWNSGRLMSSDRSKPQQATRSAVRWVFGTTAVAGAAIWLLHELRPQFVKAKARRIKRAAHRLHFYLFPGSYADERDIRALFKQYDTSGDGFIQSDELREVFRKVLHHPLSAEEVEAMLEFADLDHHHQLDYVEFYKLMIALKDVEKRFHEFDADFDGFVTADDIQKVMSDLGQPLSEEEIAEMIREADWNEDGRIEWKEFAWITMRRNDIVRDGTGPKPARKAKQPSAKTARTEPALKPDGDKPAAHGEKR